MPLVSAVLVYVVMSLNTVVLLLAPLSLALAVVLLWRSDRRGVLLWLGLAANVLLTVLLVGVIVNLALNGR